MATEQYQIGYEEGYQEGWNAAMEGSVLSAAPTWCNGCTPENCFGCHIPSNEPPTPPAEQQAAPKAAPGEPAAIKMVGYGGCTGINDYLMSDGTIKTMRPHEVVWREAPQQEAQEPMATLHCNDIGYVWARATEVGKRMRFEQPLNLYTAPQPAPAPLSDVSALIAEARENKIRARAFEADAARWRLVETASSDVTLRLHNLRPDQRAQYIDAVLAAQGGRNADT